MKKHANGTTECARCHFLGEFREGSMDEINEFQKTHKSVFSGQGALNTASAAVKGPAPSGNTELKNKLNSLKGKKTDDFEIL